MKIGILAVQGAFEEHKKMLSHWSVDCLELRNRADVFRGLDGLILPGGESTVQGKLLRELNMKQPLLDMIKEGLPVLGTCAGLILLAERLSNDPASYFSTVSYTHLHNIRKKVCQSRDFVTRGIGRQNFVCLTTLH